MNADLSVHRHLAERMDERLLLLRHAPKNVILHGADGDISRHLLATRYPQAHFTEFDHRADWLQTAADARQNHGGWLAKLWGKNYITQTLLSGDATLPKQVGDMLWANVMLPNLPNLNRALSDWASALCNEGLLFFTCFGVESLPEICAIWQQAGISFDLALLPEMHDLGDALLSHGFYDPIVDTAKLVLSYQNFETLLRDLETWGVWFALHPTPEKNAHEAVWRAWQQGLLREITLETVFGHAVKKAVLPNNEQVVRFYPK